jgi:ABC-type sugar transport system substrate-binding protein
MASRKVALFLTNADNDYQQGLKREAEAAAAKAGFELEVFFAGAHPGKISIEQPQQIYRVVNRDPARRPVATIIFPLMDVPPTVKDVVAARVGLVILRGRPKIVEELRNANPGLPIFAVSSDQLETGRVQGRQLRALVPEGGTVLGVFGNPLANSAIERAAGLREVLEGSPIRLTTVNGDWGADSGEEVFSKWIRQPWNKEKLAAIACHNDAMAMGVRKAVKKAASEAAFAYLGGIPILGIDGSPDVGLKAVDSGELAATIVMPPVTKNAVELLARALAGEKIPAFVTLEPKPYPEHLATR